MRNIKTSEFLQYMSDIQKYNNSITAINDKWEVVKLMCEMNGSSQLQSIIPNMVKIKQDFLQLQDKLIVTLIEESIHKVNQKMISKAQVAVDILIRNLYERTADVGFLATDEEIRRFISKDAENETSRAVILMRLQEYVTKYSVYEEIIILDKSGKVLVNLDQNNPILGTVIIDPILEKTLTRTESFIESYQPSPLQPGKQKAHIFSSKILDAHTQEVIGIICLCFKLENELDQIFHKLSNNHDGSVIMIIDESNHVIASSDSSYIPAGTYTEEVFKEQTAVIYYRGAEYLCKTVSTQGYQGYHGLGWKGQVMLPLALAFKDNSTLKEIDDKIHSCLMAKAESFSLTLKEIFIQIEYINQSLKRIVYNGQLIPIAENDGGEYTRLKALLNTIGQIGINTGTIFQQAAQNLFSTIISSCLNDVSFLASLCVDIIDRNLYERANDCRWWALDSTFRTILSQPHITEYNTGRLTAVLSYINSLYTVYSNLFLFDKDAVIVAVSNPDHEKDIGIKLSKEFVQSVLLNSREDLYYVSPFEASDLYNGKHTYIYAASITDPDDPNHTAGGIGIVFDSEYQFRSMLEDAVPLKDDRMAVFVDRDCTVISSTSDKFTVGEKLELPDYLFKIPCGNRKWEILLINDCYYGVGYAASSSYREYKSSDGYVNDVLALVFEKLSEAGSDISYDSKKPSISQGDIQLSPDEKHIRLAVFSVHNQLFAFDQSCVLQVMEAANVQTLQSAGKILCGYVLYEQHCISVFNMHTLLFQHSEQPICPYLIILRGANGIIAALEVDNAESVIEINESMMKPIPALTINTTNPIGIIIIGEDSQNIVQVLDHNSLLYCITNNESNTSQQATEHEACQRSELRGI